MHAHGSGFGVAVLEGKHPEPELDELLGRLAEDIALFDQRGCLSPRVLLLNAESSSASAIAERLVDQLRKIEQRVPRGRLTAEEAAEIAKYRDTTHFVGELFEAGSGFVSVGRTGQWLLPPTGRNIHLLTSPDPIAALNPVRHFVTSCAFAGEPPRRQALGRSLPGARLCRFGEMQRPPFDGPVDRRES